MDCENHYKGHCKLAFERKAISTECTECAINDGGEQSMEQEIWEEELLGYITEKLYDMGADDDGAGGVVDCIRTYEEAMIMTRDHGLVVRFMDGREFQITVIQSK